MVQRSATGRRLFIPALIAGLLLAAPLRAQTEATAPVAVDAVPAEAQLSGEDIYERVVANRFRSYLQEVRLLSGDRAGSEQEAILVVGWQDFREPEDESAELLSKTRIRYEFPPDIRDTTYLIVNNRTRPNDQFVYLPSWRKVRRVNLRGENLFGSDFSFEDVVPRDLEDSTYRRLPDAQVQGVPVWVVEATPRQSETSEYSKFLLHVEKAHAVPLENHYWDASGVLIKKLHADAGSIREFEGVWLPLAIEMENLVTQTESRLTIEKLVPNPELHRGYFDLRSLIAH